MHLFVCFYEKPQSVFFMFVYFERERERERETERERASKHEQGRGRGRERISSRLHAVSTQLDSGLDLNNHKIMT